MVHNKIERKILPAFVCVCVCVYSHTASLIINITHRIITSFAKAEPTMTHDNHTKSIIYLRVNSWCCTFYDLDKCVKTYPSLPCHVEFPCSKTLHVLLITPQSWKPLSFLGPHSFTFSRVSYTWNPTSVVFSQGFPHGSNGKESAHNARDLGSIPGLGRSPGEGNGTPLQYSFLENPINRGAWQATVHGAAKSQAQLSD